MLKITIGLLCDIIRYVDIRFQGGMEMPEEGWKAGDYFIYDGKNGKGVVLPNGGAVVAYEVYGGSLHVMAKANIPPHAERVTLTAASEFPLAVRTALQGAKAAVGLF